MDLPQFPLSEPKLTRIGWYFCIAKGKHGSFSATNYLSLIQQRFTTFWLPV